MSNPALCCVKNSDGRGDRDSRDSFGTQAAADAAGEENLRGAPCRGGGRAGASLLPCLSGGGGRGAGTVADRWRFVWVWGCNVAAPWPPDPPCSTLSPSLEVVVINSRTSEGLFAENFCGSSWLEPLTKGKISAVVGLAYSEGLGKAEGLAFGLENAVSGESTAQDVGWNGWKEFPLSQSRSDVVGAGIAAGTEAGAAAGAAFAVVTFCLSSAPSIFSALAMEQEPSLTPRYTRSTFTATSFVSMSSSTSCSV